MQNFCNILILVLIHTKGDKHVLFSGVVAKYNKNYKRQDRVLLITERAVYNLDPNGYMINRRIPLRRVKGIMVSPLTDGYFIMNIPDEYDYLLESNKKTEILKVLTENYTAATRSTLKFVCKEKFVTLMLVPSTNTFTASITNQRRMVQCHN